jgi:uncharacterized protein YjaG (DUF416 family)
LEYRIGIVVVLAILARKGRLNRNLEYLDYIMRVYEDWDQFAVLEAAQEAVTLCKAIDDNLRRSYLENVLDHRVILKEAKEIS